MTAPFDPDFQGLNDCGCCEGAAVETPAEVTNRPGLTAIAARIGTHARFKQTMLARLSSADRPALRGLSTRDDNDLAIALLDAWACVADVLTFYQERIANEGYLRTATEWLSLMHLARLIGYEPRPGVAAETHLRFTLEDAVGAPARVEIPAGTRVQSIPGAGERPQTFETSETIEARPAWNSLRPRQTMPQELDPDANRIVFRGTDSGLKRGDPLLIVARRDDGMMAREFRIARLVTVDRDRDRTIVVLNGLPPVHHPFSPKIPQPSGLSSFAPQPLSGEAVADALLDHVWRQVDLEAFAKVQGWSLDDVVTSLTPRPGKIPQPEARETGVFALRTRASLFGHNAPDSNTLATTIKKVIGADLLDWQFTTPSKRNLDLDTVYPRVQPGSWIVVTRPDATIVARVLSAEETGLSQFGLSAKVTRVEIDEDVEIATFVELRRTTVYAESQRLDLADLPIEVPVAGDSIELERLCEGLTSSSGRSRAGSNPGSSPCGGATRATDN